MAVVWTNPQNTCFQTGVEVSLQPLLPLRSGLGRHLNSETPVDADISSLSRLAS